MGTVVAYLTDSTRGDADFADGRPITVQLWYPAAAATGNTRTAYLVETGLGAMLVSTGYYGIDTAALKKWPTVHTHSRLDAEPLYSDADFARRGLTRAQWVKRSEGGRIMLDSVLARARAPLWMGFVAATGHLSFSDAPFVMPSAISRFGGKIIDAKRGLLVITATMRAFFDQELGGKAVQLAGIPARYPEVSISRVGEP